jgi:hypothetical protein
MKAEFPKQIIEKYSNINFIRIRPVGAEPLHAGRRIDRRKDRRDESNSHFPQICERA